MQQYYGLSLYIALIDTLVYTFLLTVGFILLENIFSFYLPTKGNIILIFIFPVSFAIIVLFTGDYILQFTLQQELEYQQFINKIFLLRGFIILLLFAVCTLLLNYHGRLEEQAEVLERESQMQQMAKEAELYHLRQQLQPHFLFNSLNSISALVNSKPEQAREMVLQLSDFLRATIRKDEKKWIGLEEEIAFLKLFTEIEKVRFGHRLKVDFFVPNQLKDLKLPQLLLQPLLENAVKHSLYGLTGEVEIQLKFVRKGNALNVSISNPYDPQAGQPNGAGFGIKAVERRLFLIFGRYDLLKKNQSNDTFKVELLIPQMHD
jgi:LytS/YehU family sensor histidine kinase